VVDTPTETWLEKARSDRESTTNFPNRRIPGTGNNSSLVRNATPFNKNYMQMRVGGLGNKMRFSLNGNNSTSATSATAYNPANTLSDNTAYEVSVRVKVCVNGLLE